MRSNRGFLLLAVLLFAVGALAAPLRRGELASGFSHRGSDPIKVAFFDADGTLRVAQSGHYTAKTGTDVVLLPNVAEKIRELNEQGYLVVIVSNQGQVSTGKSLGHTSELALFRTVRLLQAQRARVDYYDYAEAVDQFRKPEVGMAQRLEKLLKEKFGVEIDRKNSFMVGDFAHGPTDVRPDGKPGTDHNSADRVFADNFGIPFRDAADFFGWRTLGVERFRSAEDVTRAERLLQCGNSFSKLYAGAAH